MGFETPQFQPEKSQEESWQDLYGETEIEFGPGGKVKITERKSGETEEKTLEKPDDPETEGIRRKRRAEAFVAVPAAGSDCGKTEETFTRNAQRIKKRSHRGVLVL